MIKSLQTGDTVVDRTNGWQGTVVKVHDDYSADVEYNVSGGGENAILWTPFYALDLVDEVSGHDGPEHDHDSDGEPSV
jgi:hypothetical protein